MRTLLAAGRLAVCAGLIGVVCAHALVRDLLADGTLLPTLLSASPETALAAAGAGTAFYTLRLGLFLGIPTVSGAVLGWRVTGSR